MPEAELAAQALPSLRAQLRAKAVKALARWHDDPVLFAKEVLRVDVWSGQAELLGAIVAHPAVACRSGHKLGKSTALAIIALWWVCTRPRARVVMTAASHRQVEKVLYKEIRRLHARAARRSCSECGGSVPCETHPDKVRRGLPIGGDLHESAEAGLQFSDGREIVGFSTKEPERMAGFSGANLLFLVDEASGVPDEIFEAMEGNRAGGARIAMTSNPTQTSGVFYDAFTSDRSEWFQVHLSSERVAREIEEGKFPAGMGLATPEWVAEKKRTWGVEDARYQVRVLGDFPRAGDDSMIGLALVEKAKLRWRTTPPPFGRTTIGVDVAWKGTDSTVLVWCRGDWSSEPEVLKGFDPVEVAEKVMNLARKVRLANERPIVRIDSSNMGAGVFAILKREEEVEAIGMLAAESSTVEGFSRLRDETWGSLEAWLKTGAIAPDAKLIADVLAPKRQHDVRGHIKVESKFDLRKRIGRSTDRADALALAVYRGKTDNSGAIFDAFENTPKAAW
jgi:phage terminase large subunit